MKKRRESKWDRERRIKREKFAADMKTARDTLSRLVASGLLPNHGNRDEYVMKALDVIAGHCARKAK